MCSALCDPKCLVLTHATIQVSAIFITYNEETAFDSAAMSKRYFEIMKTVPNAHAGTAQCGVAAALGNMDGDSDKDRSREALPASKRARADESDIEDEERQPDDLESQFGLALGEGSLGDQVD